MENVEASETNNKPRSVTTLSKSSMIIADRDNVYKNIRVLISQLLGIDPKINVVPDVSSLAHPDNNTKSPRDNPDEHAPTLSPEKSQDKERPEDITNELVNNDKNHVDQPIDIVNIEELNFDDIPIGQRLTPDIAKRLKNRKGQDVGSSNTSSKSVRKKASVGPTKRWSKVVTPISKKKSLKRKEVPFESSESDHNVEHIVQDIISTSRKQASGKKIPANIPGVPLDNVFFTLLKMFKNGNMFIKEGFGKYYEILVKEFIVNISRECDNKRSKEFRKVEITANPVKEWTRKGKLSASALSVKYVVLHEIGAPNWVPTNHTSNIAIALDFASFIGGVILSQHPSILINSNSTCNMDPPLSLHYRLFTRKHVPDIVMTSGKAPSRSTDKTGILAEPKDNCKTLDETIKSCTERKSKIEMFIKALSEEKGGVKDDGTDEEEENEDMTGASDEEDTNNDKD
ncbi:uncharacterized protein LOC127096297 [Lathyrus oleraceus]|uniref:uncharacterized protein LOC127096297 n=1 Tax=Pisum sativum TaxID=3888 RepID=UPI0021CFF6A5|nr:uncharacterized protein LOC127096297 [Pisum sativum]